MTNFFNDWNFRHLEYLIQDRGEDVLHEKGVACPCRKQDHYGSTIEHDGKPATQRDIGCTQCDRNGFMYRDPRIIKGLVTGIHPGNTNLVDFGRAMPGDAVLSPSLCTSVDVMAFDKITLCSPVPVGGDGQQLMRNSSNLSDNKLLSVTLTDDEDRLWYQASKSIWCEDQNGVEYRQQTDFVFDQKKIRWIGNRPADGVFYTIKYTAYTEWIVYTEPQQRFDRARNLGPQVLLKKVHVAFPDDVHDTPQNRGEEAIQFKLNSKI